MKLIKRLTLIVITALTVFSCENDSTEKGSFDDLSDYAKNYFKMSRNNGLAQAGVNSASQLGNPANISFQGLYNRAFGMSPGRIAEDSSKTEPSDTTIYPSPWISCAKISVTQNDDGSTTTIYDYGDGCQEGDDYYKYWMMGKYAYTYRNTYSNNGSVFKDSYYYQSSCENYGGKYYDGQDSSMWVSDGTSVYEGESEYDTAQQTYSGNYNSTYDYTYKWNAQQYIYKGVCKSSYTEKRYVVEQNNYEYTNDNNYYKTQVLEPLVMRYDCPSGLGLKNDMMYFTTFVSGREFIRYRQDDKEGSFEINYGDGECDNIITIIENGKSVDVDLSNQLVYSW